MPSIIRPVANRLENVLSRLALLSFDASLSTFELDLAAALSHRNGGSSVPPLWPQAAQPHSPSAGNGDRAPSVAAARRWRRCRSFSFIKPTAIT